MSNPDVLARRVGETRPAGGPSDFGGTMQYLLAFYEPATDFAARDGGDPVAFWPAWVAYFEALNVAGVMAGGAPLQAPATAGTVRNGAGGRTIHDGPYADTKEQLGGYTIVDVPSIDEALAWARRAPCARDGAVEVRPVLPPADDAAAERVRVPSARFTHALAIYETPADFASREGAEAGAYWSRWGAYAGALAKADVAFGGCALRGPETATVVRVATDGPVVHDGPYADTKEQLGGVMLVNVASPDDALQWAARCPAAFGGAVEVRPILPVAARMPASV